MFNRELFAIEAWNTLTKNAQKSKHITYEDLADILKIHHPSVNIHHRSIRLILDLIQSYCVDNYLPPLTILIVNKSTGLPGEGFTAWDIRDLQSGRMRVYNSDWAKIANPFTYARTGETVESMVDKISNDPNHSETVFKSVEDRSIKQKIFRDLLLKSYQWKCAFTGFSITSTLDAAHIIPWSQSDIKNKINPRNGILLISYCHRLFDQELITIDENYRIRTNTKDLKKYINNIFDASLTTDLDMKEIRLPIDKNLWPDEDLILKRNKNIDWV